MWKFIFGAIFGIVGYKYYKGDFDKDIDDAKKAYAEEKKKEEEAAE